MYFISIKNVTSKLSHYCVCAKPNEITLDTYLDIALFENSIENANDNFKSNM